MPELKQAPYSYGEDLGAPAFKDIRARFVFDGTYETLPGRLQFSHGLSLGAVILIGVVADGQLQRLRNALA